MMRQALFLLCVTLILISSCATHKEIIRVKQVPLDVVLDGMQKQKRDYHWFTAKARIKLDGVEMDGSGRSNIIMVKDSIIWMNFKKFGFEGARVLMSSDSCFVVYRRDNMYERGTINEFLDAYKLYVSFTELQNLIIGEFPIPDQKDVLKFNSDKFHEIEFYKDAIHYSYQIKADYSIHALMIEDDQGRKMKALMSDYNENGFSTRKELMIFTPEDGNATISIKLTGVNFDVPKNIYFEIPDHYREI